MGFTALQPNSPTAGGFKPLVASPIAPTNANPLDGFSMIDYHKPLINDIVKNTASDYTNAIPNFLNAAQSGQSSNPIIKAGEGALAATASGIGTIFAPISESIKSVAQDFANKAKTPFTQGSQPVTSDNPTGSQNLYDHPIIGKLLDFFSNSSGQLDKFSQAHPEAAQNLGNALTVGLTAAGGETGASEKPVGSFEGIKAGLGDTTQSVREIPKEVLNASKSLVQKILPDSSELMNKVARVNPTDAAKFKAMSGGSDIGTFLDERGLHGSTEDVIGKTYSRYIQSKAEVDKTFEKIPGQFKNPSVTTALTDLVAREKSISPEGVASTDLARSEELLTKSKEGGLTMPEINETKRLYERNVKTDYVKENKPTAVARATNIDTHIREFQANLAAERGFKNLLELNKETQLNRFITDKLGKRFDGQLGNNGISLSDWLVASQIPAHPAALLELISKKIFDSSNFYGKAARILSNGEKIGVPSADYQANNPLQLPEGDRNNTFPVNDQNIILPSKGVLKSQQNIK